MAYQNEADIELEKHVDAIEWIHLGQIKRLIKFFKNTQRYPISQVFDAALAMDGWEIIPADIEFAVFPKIFNTDVISLHGAEIGNRKISGAFNLAPLGEHLRIETGALQRIDIAVSYNFV